MCDIALSVIVCKQNSASQTDLDLLQRPCNRLVELPLDVRISQVCTLSYHPLSRS
jgi:hypothetical protein